MKNFFLKHIFIENKYMSIELTTHINNCKHMCVNI